LLYAFEGDSTDDSFGVSVSGAGDVNGDGLDDFVVGALYGGANNGGYARLFVSQTKILGDVDLSGEVTFADIPALIEVLRTGALLREADCNQDGVVDFDDIPDFIKILTNS
jgi:hypothetical protein